MERSGAQGCGRVGARELAVLNGDKENFWPGLKRVTRAEVPDSDASDSDIETSSEDKENSGPGLRRVRRTEVPDSNASDSDLEVTREDEGHCRPRHGKYAATTERKEPLRPRSVNATPTQSQPAPNEGGQGWTSSEVFYSAHVTGPVIDLTSSSPVVKSPHALKVSSPQPQPSPILPHRSNNEDLTGLDQSELTPSELNNFDAVELDIYLSKKFGDFMPHGDDNDSSKDLPGLGTASSSADEDDLPPRVPSRRRYAEAFDDSDDDALALAIEPAQPPSRKKRARIAPLVEDSDDDALDLAADLAQPPHHKKRLRTAPLVEDSDDSDNLDRVDPMNVDDSNVVETKQLSPKYKTATPQRFVFQTTRSRRDGSLTARTSSLSTSITQARMIPTVEAVAAPASISSHSLPKRVARPSPSRRHASLVLFKMPSTFTAFETQLGEYVGELFRLGEMEMTPDCYQLLRQHSVQGWVVHLSRITLADVKRLLESEDAPTVEDFLALAPIDNSYSPGVYIGIIITDRLLHDGHDFTYVGSATAPGRGLQYRCNRHLDKNYRDTERSKGTENFHYAVVDEEGKGRVESFRKLAETEFEINESEHISDVRFACTLLEQILMCWTRSFASTTAARFPELAKMSPWDSVEYLGTNRRVPMRQPPPSRTDPAPGVTREERLKRDAEMASRNRARMTATERREHVIQQAFYKQRVLDPVTSMRTAGASAETIKAFQDVARKEYREAKKRHMAGSSKANIDGTGKSAIMAAVEELQEKLKSKKKAGSDLRSFFKGA